MNGICVHLVLSFAILNVIEEAIGHSCDQTEMLQCFQNMNNAIREENLFFPGTKENLQKYCEHLKKGLDCSSRITNRCLNEEEKDLFKNFTSGIAKMNKDMCTEGSEISRRYMKHISCFRDTAEEFNECTQHYITNLMAAKDMEANEQVRITCCSFQEYGKCMKAAVLKRCNEDAANLVEEAITTTLGSGIQYCSQFTNIPSENCLGGKTHLFTRGGIGRGTHINDNACNLSSSLSLVILIALALLKL